MEMGRRLRDAADRGLIDSIRLQMLNVPLSELANAQGGLERIKNTPLPRHYSQLPQLFTIVYCLLLPLGLVSDLQLYTPVGSTVIGFMFLALYRTGRYLEEPMAGTVHDVPMLAITTTIEIDLLQAIGETEIPAPVQSRRGILL
jgi:putative membrane protein